VCHWGLLQPLTAAAPTAAAVAEHAAAPALTRSGSLSTLLQALHPYLCISFQTLSVRMSNVLHPSKDITSQPGKLLVLQSCVAYEAEHALLFAMRQRKSSCGGLACRSRSDAAMAALVASSNSASSALGCDSGCG